MKKTRLQIEYDYNFSLLGIVAHVKEYKLAWSINQALDINLIKQEDIIIPKLDNRDLIISNLLFETENSFLRLISNRSTSEGEEVSNLLPELQNFTHFILFQDAEGIMDAQLITEKLKEISSIDYIVGIDPGKLKNKDNLIF